MAGLRKTCRMILEDRKSAKRKLNVVRKDIWYNRKRGKHEQSIVPTNSFNY